MYSEDLKKRAINLYHKIKSYRTVENLLNIGKSTLQRWVVFSKKINDTPCIDNIVAQIKQYLDDNKFVTLVKIQSNLLKKFNKKYSIGFIYNIIKKTLKYSYKKISNKYYNKSLDTLKQKQQLFIDTIKDIDKNKIICIDETYIHSNYTTNYGWSKIGEPIIQYKQVNPVKYSIIMAISNKRIIDYKINNKNINSKIFFEFMSNLNNQYNNYYFLMDNVSFHKSASICNIFINYTNKLLYIPPYSPEFNPIEEVFSQIKRLIRNHPYSNIIKKFKICIKEVKQKHLFNYYKHSFEIL